MSVAEWLNRVIGRIYSLYVLTMIDPRSRVYRIIEAWKALFDRCRAISCKKNSHCLSSVVSLIGR